MSCVLRICGKDLDIAALLAQHALAPETVWRTGEPRLPSGKFYSTSGAHFIVSEAEFEDFAGQLAEATTFLEVHFDAIAKMTAVPGVDIAVLDFAVGVGADFLARFCAFPAGFVGMAARLRLALEVSVYACAEDEDD